MEKNKINLTEEQKKLVELDEFGNLKIPKVAVLADAGTGKTSTLEARVKNFIEANERLFKDLKKKILCISFTEKSAADLKARLSKYIEVEVYTIHGFCNRIIHENINEKELNIAPDFKILTEDEDSALFSECFEKVFFQMPLDCSENNKEEYFEVFLKCKKKNLRQSSAIERSEYRLDVSIERSEHSNCIETFNSDLNKILNSFYNKLFSKYLELKNKLNVLSYDDLEEKALFLLKKPHIANKYKERFIHVFVDEFQDTNQRQCELVNAITGEKSALFVVGDEKQSIYRFRGAQVDVFKKFTDELKVKHRLSKNFRSDPEIIEYINSVFLNNSLIENYKPMQAGVTSLSQVLDKKILYVKSYEDDAQNILNLLKFYKEKNIDLSKVIILLRAFESSGAKRILRSLLDLGIKLVYFGTPKEPDDNLKKLIALWIWASKPNFLYIGAHVLKFYQNEVKSLLNYDLSYDLLIDIEKNLKDLKKKLNLDSNHTIEERIFYLNSIFNLEKKFGGKFIEFYHYLIKAKSMGLTVYDIALEFERVLLDNSFSKKEPIKNYEILPPPLNLENVLKVMTIHASKGLEFDYVILPYFRDYGNNNRTFILPTHEKVYFLAKDEEGNRAENEESDKILQREKILEEQERARLLYVALTRAMHGISIVEVEPKPEKKGRKGTVDSHLECLLNVEKNLIEEFNYKFSEEQNANSLSVIQDKNHKKSFFINNQISALEYKAARTGITALVKSSLSQDKEDLNFKNKEKSMARTAQDYSDIGTRVHEFLQRLDFKGLKDYLDSQKINADSFFNWIDSKNEMVEKLFSRDAIKEFAFDWAHEEFGILTGRIDSLVQSSKDEWWIADYKVIFSNKSKDELITQYSPQLEKYREAIQKLCNTKNVRVFIIDVLCASGEILIEI